MYSIVSTGRTPPSQVGACITRPNGSLAHGLSLFLFLFLFRSLPLIGLTGRRAASLASAPAGTRARTHRAEALWVRSPPFHSSWPQVHPPCNHGPDLESHCCFGQWGVMISHSAHRVQQQRQYR